MANCNWNSRNGSLYVKDSCLSNVYFIETGISFNGMFSGKYKCEWKLDTVKVGSNSSVQKISISQNGTYTICVKVTDTINNCDTVYCRNVVVNCISNCNWKSRNGNLYLKDSCSGTVNFIEAGVSFNGMFSGKYKCYWSLNGVRFGNRGAVQKMPVFQNGNYIVCVKVEDTVSFCDTTFCAHVEVDCITECLWSQRGIQMYRNDSCKGVNNRKSMNVYLDIDHKGCMSYRWKVNGVVQTESRPYLSYTLSKDTSYQVCVEISDTCLDCDTVICSTYTTNCFGNAVSNADVSIIQVYPNPVNDILQVKTDVQLKVSILNLLGVEELSKELQEGVNTLSVQSLSPGIYLLKTETKDGHSATRRLIIE